MTRDYAQRQDSYWFPEEWNYLKSAVEEPDIRALLAAGDNDKARGELVQRFRAKFTGPVEGESEADFKKRVRGTSKARRQEVTRRVTESREAWDTRMQTLPDVSVILLTMCNSAVYSASGRVGDTGVVEELEIKS